MAKTFHPSENFGGVILYDFILNKHNTPWGVAPNPTKKLFTKSFLDFQKP